MLGEQPTTLEPPFSAEYIQTHSMRCAPLEQALGAIPIVWTDQTEKMHLSRMTVEQCLVEELSVSRLSSIHRYLWWAGRPAAARALSCQRICRREIIITEQTDLHLVWSDSRICIKPLPAYLLSYEFWKAHLCDDKQLHESARGFLLSYIWLIRHESDLKVAKECKILPEHIAWKDWETYVKSIACKIDFNCLYGVDKRYTYGELRLNRLNQIYRFAPQFRFRYLIRGYASNHHTYGSFFQKNFAWLLILFAYGSTLLSALQVGLATNELGSNAKFQGTAYGFAVLVIVFALSIAILMGLLYAVLFVFYLFIAVVYEREKTFKRKKWIEEKI
jgi:hypothetical protein